jgi:hypothetical protein
MSSSEISEAPEKVEATETSKLDNQKGEECTDM